MEKVCFPRFDQSKNINAKQNSFCALCPFKEIHEKYLAKKIERTIFKFFDDEIYLSLYLFYHSMFFLVSLDLVARTGRVHGAGEAEPAGAGSHSPGGV